MAARAVTRAYDDALRPTGLRASQLALLVAIDNNDGAISITAVAKVMGMDRSTLTRNLRPLEKEFLVAIGLEGGRRSRSLQITKKGQSRLREALPLWQRAQDSLRRIWATATGSIFTRVSIALLWRHSADYPR
jgi:DNA-binding MarR family transcriptional regulator